MVKSHPTSFNRTRASAALKSRVMVRRSLVGRLWWSLFLLVLCISYPNISVIVAGDSIRTMSAPKLMVRLQLRGGYTFEGYGCEVFDPIDTSTNSAFPASDEGEVLTEAEFSRDEEAAKRDGCEYVDSPSEEAAKLDLDRRPAINENSTIGLDAKRLRHELPDEDEVQDVLDPTRQTARDRITTAGRGGEESSDFEEQGPDSKETIKGRELREACLAGEEERVLRLSNQIANIDKPSSTGVTAFMAACANGNLQLMSMLLARGANIMARDVHNQSSLHIAAQFGKVEAARYLLSHGVDAQCITLYGDTARDTAIMHQQMHGYTNHPVADHDPARSKACGEVAALLEREGVRKFDPDEPPLVRITRTFAQWPKEEGEIVDDTRENRGEDSASSEAKERQYNESLRLALYCEKTCKAAEEDPSFDTHGRVLKRPVYGPAGDGWRDHWGRSQDFYCQAETEEMERLEKEGCGIEDGLESTCDPEKIYHENTGLKGWELETKAEEQDRLVWRKHENDYQKIIERIQNGETEEEIIMEDLEKGPPPDMEPTLMDLEPHFRDKMCPEEKLREVIDFMQPVVEAQQPKLVEDFDYLY